LNAFLESYWLLLAGLLRVVVVVVGAAAAPQASYSSWLPAVCLTVARGTAAAMGNDEPPIKFARRSVFSSSFSIETWGRLGTRVPQDVGTTLLA